MTRLLLLIPTTSYRTADFVGAAHALDVEVAVGSNQRPVLEAFTDVSVANSHSRGDREFEKATAMLFPSEIAQGGRMRDHTAAHFRRRVSI